MATPISNLRLRSINSPQALEGGDLLFDIAFVAAANVATNLNLNFAGIAEKGVDYQASFQASFDGGRSFQTYSGTSLDVPVGCTGVLVKVSSIEDQIFEKSERVTITASVNQDTLTSSGLIVNDDKPALTVVSVTGDEKVEGNNLVFTVQLDGNIPNTQFPPGSVCPHPAWTCTQDGGKGTIDLGGYSITLQEHNSTWVLTNKATGISTRIWGDPHVDLGNNGSTEFDFKKSMSFQLSDGTKITVDTVPFGNSGETLSSKLTITDWCGSKAMVVTGLGWDYDGANNLQVQKLDGQGKALDLATADGAFTLYENPDGNWNIFDGRVANQNLINKLESGELVDCGSTVNLSLAAGTAVLSQDFLAPIEVSMDNGVTWSLANAGSVRVPTGIDSFLARVATVDDSNTEITENLTLSAKSGTSIASALGNIVDNDAIPSTVTSVSSVVANEGEPLQFEVVLSGASTVSTNLTLNLANGTATGGADFATTGLQVSFNNGLTWTTLSSNVVSVPANASSLLVKVAGIEDQVFEGTSEAFTLSATANGSTASGIGTICEDDAAPRVNTITNAQVNEGDALTFDVTLSRASSTATTVSLALANGTASSTDYAPQMQVSFNGGTTYVNVSGTSVNVPAGATGFKVRVASTEDTLVEGNETFTLQASANGGSATGTGTILNDDVAPPPPPPPVLACVTAVSSVTADEGDPLQFKVDLGPVSTVATALTLNLTNGTATGAVDFATTGVQVSFNNGQTWTTLASNNVSVPAGSTSLLVKVAGLEDNVYEGTSEAFTLSASANGSTASGIGTICEDDAAPRVNTITNAQVNEGDSLTFDVTLSRASSTATTVSLALANGTASSTDYAPQMQVSFNGGTTYVNVTGTSVNVPAGATGFKVRVASTEDTLVEGNETFTLQASANGGSATGTGTILNDDVAPPPPPPPVLACVTAVSSVTADEGDPLQFKVDLGPVSTVATALTLNLTNGTATGAVDFATTGVQVSFNNGQTWTTISSNSVSVPAGSTSLLVKVAGLEDNVYEGTSEAFTLSATANGATASGIGTICEDDAAPRVNTITNAQVNEGDSLTFDVTLSRASSTATTVSLALANGTASSTDYAPQMQVSFNGGTTYVNVSGTSVNVPAGATGFKVRVASTEDTLVEGNETFTLQASANGGSATGTGTILNDDVAPPPPPPPVVEAKVLGVSCASANEGDPLQFQVTLDGASAVTKVTLNLTSGTAAANVDFATTGVQASFDAGKTWTTLTSNSVSVPAGSTSLLVKVQSVEDSIYEGGSETFSLTAATKSSSATGIGSILNDEEPILGISSVSGGGAIEGCFLQFDVGLHGTVAYPSVPPGSTCPPENWTFKQTGSTATIDLGNYCIQLQEKLASWTLINKETGQSTRIWGDPHVDIGNDGQTDFDFKENMTFQLSDGTKITVDTVEWERSGQTLSSKLTITDWAGQNAMVVTGLGWYSDGVANLKVEEFEGQGQALDLGTSDGSMTLYENNAGGWKIFDGRAATQVLVNQLENGLLVDPGSTITLALSQGSATLGADYLDKLEVSMDGGKTWLATDAGTVRIPVGVDHLIARMPTIDDTTGEPLEHVRLTATASTTALSADGAIFDNDASVSSYTVSLTEAPQVDTWVTVQVGGVTAQGATLFNSEGQSVLGSAVKVLVHAGETESQPFLLQNPANATGGTHLPLNLTITNLEAVTAQTASENSDAPTLRDILIDTGEGEIDLAALGVRADPRLTATVVAGVESKLDAADIHGGAIDIEHFLHKPATTPEG